MHVWNRTVLLTVILCAGVAGCSPLPFHLTDQVPESVLQNVQSQYHSRPAVAVLLDDTSKAFTVTKVSKNAGETWYGDRTGLIFPIGTTFSSYLSQIQTAAINGSRQSPTPLTAHLVSADLSYSSKGFLNWHLDWVDLVLTITTVDRNGHAETTTLHRSVSAPPDRSGQSDAALTEALTMLALDYWETVLKRTQTGTIAERQDQPVSALPVPAHSSHFTSR